MKKKEEILSQLNDQQKLPVVNYKENMVVISGAGSGKERIVNYGN
nr:MAG TPA: UvrD/REP helicase [Bacteriophage sp.]